MLLLAATAVAVIAFFARDARGETTWSRLTAPALAAVLLTGIAALAVLHYATLLGVPPGSPAAWALPSGYAAVAVLGVGWGAGAACQAPGRVCRDGLGRVRRDRAARLADGIVLTTPDQAAVALWLPVCEQSAGPRDGYDQRLAEVTGPWADRFRAFDAALERRHPAGFAHHYLAILAVRPDRQGQGLATALLRAPGSGRPRPPPGRPAPGRLPGRR